MELGYYPGCTLKTKAQNLEESALASMAALGVNLVELPRWNCCGAACSLAEDELVHQLAPIRNLVRAKEQGYGKLVTICSLCYQVLKRANLLVRTAPDKRQAINSFMDEEIDYDGEVRVVHLLEVLRDDIGWENLARAVKIPLSGLRIAPYYGCTLLRPKEVALDSPDAPTILDKFLEALGATPVYFPLSLKCCGSFQIVAAPEQTNRCSRDILESAVCAGAEALVLSCPLCSFNLDRAQAESRQPPSANGNIPVLYFTQLLAISLGLAPHQCHFELNYGQPERFLQSKGLLI